MKKILLFFMVLAAYHTFGQANVYKPFPDIYGDWWALETTYPTVYGTGGNQMFSYLYFTTGDTNINTTSYKKVNYINQGAYIPTGVPVNGFSPPSPLNQIYIGGTYQFAYRNDALNKKVYIVPGDSLNEKLWYDFNLNLGDTVWGTYSTNLGTKLSQPNKLIVTAIDSTLICGAYYKRFLCACGGGSSIPSPYGSGYLIEGMGFASHFVNTYMSNICIFEPVVTFGTESWSVDACPNELLGIKSGSGKRGLITLFPNPANDLITLQSTSDLGSVTIYNSLGQSVYYTTSKNTREQIDLSTVPAGVYIIKTQETCLKFIKE